ncbi:MAG: 3-oxoacid CoA-transferase subunit B [Burkholderiaceae bacterium]|nr:3-oxoacid CoA-transferase subunit B [Burkholderiaceae bacterium]MCD8516539.1 3-oxoacid CoA-transferase subunit B [Burkholderiaceae bacterium]MCD8536346.1 3-oxoacid CoA-transferase subunit B [Burkholderiaceae bacterium]
MSPLSRDELAQVLAADIPVNSYVNLGIGMPTLVAKYLKPEQGVVLHSENGILGMTALPTGQTPDIDLINASREAITLTPGASIFDHVVSFSIMRGGHLDVTILGGFQVSADGDLANWDTGEPGAIPAVGGAMDLVAGAKRVFVMMQHVDRAGRSKLVKQCTYPLTGKGVVDRVYTDLAILDVKGDRFLVRGMIRGLTCEALQAVTDAPIEMAPDCRVIAI